MIPELELRGRAAALQSKLQEKALDGALLSQRADTLYFSGTAQNVQVYIPQKGEPMVFAQRDVERAARESCWRVLPLSGISKLPELMLSAGYELPKTLGLEYDVLPVAYFERYGKAFVGCRFHDLSYDIRMIRAVKSEWEIARIAETGEIYRAILDYVPTILRPGMTEIELEGLLEAKARMLGHETIMRVRGYGSEFHLGGVVSGPQGGVPAYFDGPIGGLGASYAHPMGPSPMPIRENEPIVLDLAFVKNGYICDMTRILALGELSPRLLEAYETSRVIQEKLRHAMVPGRVTGEIYAEILSWVQSETPYGDYFMGYGRTQVRFLGHGVGLELDELPTISKGGKEVLQKGMVMAIEPKFVFPGEGAVGIEDTVLVSDEKGARYLCEVSREIRLLNP